jgi:GTP-binding protein
LQILVLNLHYDSYKGKMGAGKITAGNITKNMPICLVKEGGKIVNGRVTALMIFDGLGLREVEGAEAGEIVMVAGLEDVAIGDTISTPEFAKPLPRVEIDEPTIKMTFGVNTSPFSGKEGKMTTSRQIRERLMKELETNVALRIEEYPGSNEKFIISGRGELHLAVLIETMRREGFELEVSKPEVIFKEVNGRKKEPYEIVEIDVPQEYQGAVMQELGKRMAKVEDVSPNEANTEFHFQARLATRALIGLKSFLITATKGTVVMNTVFDEFDELLNLDLKRETGSLVSSDTGRTSAYALDNAQQRGVLFIGPGVEVYMGMVIGEYSRVGDLELNPCKEKKLTNVRASGSDDSLILATPKKMTLENCLEYIGDDELVEATPESLRIRKRFLDPNERKKQRTQ